MTTIEMIELAREAAEYGGASTGRIVQALWECCAEICERLDSIREELQHDNRND